LDLRKTGLFRRVGGRVMRARLAVWRLVRLLVVWRLVRLAVSRLVLLLVLVVVTKQKEMMDLWRKGKIGREMEMIDLQKRERK
jgi:hypothetical protein